MKTGRAWSRAQSAMMSLPPAICLCFLGECLKRGLNRLKGNNPAPVSAVPQRFTELADVRTHIDDHVNLAILDEIDEIPHSAPAEMDDPETLVCGYYKTVHLGSTPQPIFPIVHRNWLGTDFL